jgi:hypothetical protein
LRVESSAAAAAGSWSRRSRACCSEAEKGLSGVYGFFLPGRNGFTTTTTTEEEEEEEPKLLFVFMDVITEFDALF